MDDQEVRPISQADPGSTIAGSRRRRRLGAVLAVAIACIGIAFVVQFGPDDVSPLPSAGAGPMPECETDLEPHLRELRVPGLAAVIVKDGKIVCTAVAGAANVDDDVPVTPNTLFLVASISKTVTGTALMQLHERGEFELDDDINDYLPYDVTIPSAPKSQITFRQLLTHTASLRDNRSSFDKFVTQGADSPLSLAKLTEEYLTPDGEYYDNLQNFLPAAPGTVMQYANIGIVLAGYLVEEISGDPFDEYCYDNIFSPLGMVKTSWRLADIDEDELAVPHDWVWWLRRYEALEHYGQANYPDGMLRTTPLELARFLIAVMQGGAYEGKRILERPTVKEMLKRQTLLNRSQGLVWFNATVDGRVVWGHDGSDDGASAAMWFDPNANEGVILMANGTWTDESTLFEKLFEEADEY